jgi:N-glycosylase/DNA lyase
MSIGRLVNIKEIENAVMCVSDYINHDDGIQRSWINFSEEQLWIALVSCILGSRVRFETASACVQHLDQNGLLNPLDIITNPIKFERILESEMSRPIFPSYRGNNWCRYRYSRSKAEYIVRTALEIYKKNNSNLKELLMSCQNEYEARNILSEKAIGIGYKQASLFLRNIYYSENLAILDSHVIRYMILLKLVENDAKLILSNEKTYVKLEDRLYDYASLNDKSISTLDIAIWIVMRLVQREFVIWK